MKATTEGVRSTVLGGGFLLSSLTRPAVWKDTSLASEERPQFVFASILGSRFRVRLG